MTKKNFLKEVYLYNFEKEEDVYNKLLHIIKREAVQFNKKITLRSFSGRPTVDRFWYWKDSFKNKLEKDGFEVNITKLLFYKQVVIRWW